MKFLVAKLGLEEVLKLIDEEKIANNAKKFVIDRETIQLPEIPEQTSYPDVIISDPLDYESWLKTNVFEQKQKGFYGVYIKVTTGDIPTAKARDFIDIAKVFNS